MPVDHSIKDAVVDRTGKEGNAVALGSLLRSLCRFLREGAAQDDQRFPEKWLNRFGECVDSELFAALVSGEFDGASLGERRKTLIRISEQAIQLTSSDQSPRRSDRLSPVFNRIDLTTAPVTQSSYFHWQPLTAATTNEDRPPIFAHGGDKSPQPDVETYRESLRAVVDELCQQIEWRDFDCVYTHFLNLLQRYAWCIPAEGQPDPPDISLYDQSRVVSAIAACLYKHCEDAGAAIETASARDGRTRCVLVAGDVSGIQDYIFAISTTGAGGVAKRLRARSFYVQMLSDVAGVRLLREFDLPLANLLMASGGNFYVLAPNVPGAEGKLKTLQSEFNNWLLDKFHGALTISLAWTPVSDSEFADGYFGQINGRLHGALREKKKQRLADQLQHKNGWRTQFVRYEEFQGEQICKSCYRFPAKNYSSADDEKRDRETEKYNPDICDQCFDQQQLGKDLTKVKYVSFYEQSSHGYDCLGWKFVLNEGVPPPHSHPYLVARLNDPDLGEARNLPATSRYQANHVKYKDDKGGKTPWTFSEIAAEREFEGEHETTAKMLGVLKADVDYLGQVFQEGLRRDELEKGFDSIARIATLSRQMDWFFSGWLEWLLTNDARFQSCYAVYSGGDDLLIVGPRAKSLELARTINEEFARYTGASRITISAGIAVVKPRLPLAHTVKQANKALEKAKASGRNRLSALGEVSEWSKLDSLDRIYKLLADSDAPSALLYQLLRFARMWREFADPQKRDPRGLMLVPMLAETLARNVDRNKQPKLHEWGCQLLAFPFQNRKTQADLDQLALAVQWFILGRREK